MEKEKLLCETNFSLFKRKFLKRMGKSCCREFFEEFFSQFFVKTLERSTDEEETKMTTTTPPNQTDKNTYKFSNWFQLRFCESKLKTQNFVKREIV